MEKLIYLICFCIGGMVVSLSAQNTRPAYCDELPVTYEKSAASRPSLPKFNTVPTLEYKVQVAILRFTDPAEYPFHPKLIARYRPCEEVWVVESRESFTDKNEALRLRTELRNAGYSGAYLIDMLGYK